MNKNLLLIIVVLVVVGAALFFMRGGLQEEAIAPDIESETEVEAVVRYTESGYAPRSLRVEAGTEVVFLNESSESMWTASNVHPAHQALPGFDALEGFSEGESYSYTFTRTGVWQYHNHLNPRYGGEIIVE